LSGTEVLVLFAAILIEGLGLPLPAGPWLLAVGALPARSQLNPLLMRGVTLLAFFIANFVWFRAQRRTARAKFSLSYLTGARPCMAEPGIYFDRYEVRAVLVAKFLLGLNASRLPQCVVRRQIGADRIIAIERNGRSLFNPGPDEELQAGDKVLLLGTHSQLAAATALMEA
jgi:hypothetical protein